MDDELLLIDSMALAYEAFQGSRHLFAGTEPLVSMLVRTLPLVEERNALRVEVPASWTRALDPYHQTAIRCEPGADPSRPMNQHLLPAIACGAQDLLRLWPAGAHAAVRSLGYALHPLPDLVGSGGRFDPKDFRFCFRIAAFCWHDLSPSLREVLCGLCGIDPHEAQRRVAEEGFVIDMFGFRRPGEGAGCSGPSA
jgi:hypothetical protein